MCTGCGACAYYRPDSIEMIDVPAFGRRPRVAAGPQGEEAAAEALAVCPGPALSRGPEDLPQGLVPELLAGWGPVLEVWEGHAADPELRWAASSGGAASALALACIEELGCHGVLHIDARAEAPHLNETVLSRTREELLDATGSRYAPASPCEGLGKIEAAPGPCVFIGKPCDVAAAELARRRRPKLDEKLALSIGIFCAGTPSTNGTLALMRELGVGENDPVERVRYRGNGWPGNFAITPRGDAPTPEPRSYAESWGFLQEFRQWRCYVCPDHTGEFADISVGDPWYQEIPPEAAGSSLIVIRTLRGKRSFEAALAAGYLEATRSDPSILPASQPQLLAARGALFGRILTTRLMGAAAPRLRGFPTFRFWLSELGFKQKLQAFYGTAKRVFSKRLLQRHPVPERDGPA